MKRLLAVLSVAMMASGAFLAFKALANQAPQYRCKVHIGNVGTCWAGGCDYPHGQPSSCGAMNTNGTYFVYPGISIFNGYIVCDISPPCCDEQVDLGAWTSQRSDDGGFSWYDYPANNSNPLVMVGGVEDVWDVTSNGSLDGGHVWVTCSGGTGGQ